MEIVQIPVLKDNYVYLLHDPATGETACVDPSVPGPVLAELQQRKWKLDYILNTHHHWDHTDGNLPVKEATGCKIVGYRGDAHRIPGIDIEVEEGEQFSVCGQKAEILFLPGHTLGHIAYWFPEEKALFSGDVLFGLGCGRLFEGSPEMMYNSLEKLKKLPQETQIYCAHEYTEVNGGFALQVEPHNKTLIKRMESVRKARQQNQPTVPLTLSEEEATNPFLRTESREMRETFNLPRASSEEVFAAVRQRRNHY